MAKETKKALKGYLRNVPDDKKFWCSDGSVFSSLEELHNSLKSMSPKVFAAHVDKQKNDFAKWIYDVVGDVKLSESLRDVTDLKGTEMKIRTRIATIKRMTR